jgi:hypothetical protein
MDAVTGSSGGSAVPERIARGPRRRRPSGEPPPLPRKLDASGRVWIALAVTLTAIVIIVLLHEAFGSILDRWNSAFLRALVPLRTSRLTSLVRGVDAFFSSRVTIGVLRLAVLAVLVGYRRWRHLLVFLGSVIAVEATSYELSILIASPRPAGVAIIQEWTGFSFPHSRSPHWRSRWLG